MTKSELIAKIEAKLNVSNAEARQAFEATLLAINEALLDEQQIILTGIGTLSVVHRGARQGRHPRTGELIHISAGKTISFSASKTIKTALNQA